MSQHDFDIANQGFAAFRADLNNALKALGSLSSATAEPATTYANQLWYETDTNILHIRNEANSAWLDLMVIDQTTGSPSFTAGNVGIGTNAPSVRFHALNSAATVIGRFESTSASNSSTIDFPNPVNTINKIRVGSFDDDFAVLTDGTERMRIDSAGNVGIGTTTPTSIGTNVTTLDIEGSLGGAVRFERTGATVSEGYLGAFSGEVRLATIGAIPLGFRTNNIERMRIDSSGNVLVGKTSDDSGATAGIQLHSEGVGYFTRSGNSPVAFNRLSGDGSIASFRRDGTTVGQIGTTSSSFWFGANVEGIGIKLASDDLRPTNAAGSNSDNVMDLGDLAVRWDDVYATNGTIQTSDANEKQDIEELSEAERRVAVACKGLLRKYRWISSVAEKGDEARIHFGIIAQDLQAAFAAEGLDAGRYAMFISSTWWEMDEVVPATETEPERTVKKIYDTAEEAPEGATERTRLGVRYPELLAFIIAVI